MSDTEREAFEEWIATVRNGEREIHRHQSPPNDYVDPFTDMAWEAWQAAIDREGAPYSKADVEALIEIALAAAQVARGEPVAWVTKRSFDWLRTVRETNPTARENVHAWANKSESVMPADMVANIPLYDHAQPEGWQQEGEK